MTDTYLAISQIAENDSMIKRMYAAVTQQQHLGSAVLGEFNARTWVDYNNYLWASSPGWAEAWDYAILSNVEEPEYDPGKDDTVITDGMILATVQALAAPSS